MKLHYAGKYNLNPESLPHGEHRPGAVPFKELQNPRDFAVFINAGCLAVTALLMALAFWRSGGFYRAPLQFFLGVVTALFSLLPHELLHGLCFRGGRLPLHQPPPGDALRGGAGGDVKGPVCVHVAAAQPGFRLPPLPGRDALPPAPLFPRPRGPYHRHGVWGLL